MYILVECNIYFIYKKVVVRFKDNIHCRLLLVSVQRFC